MKKILLYTMAVGLLFSMMVISSQHAKAAANNELIGYWNFDQGSGNFANDSVGTNNGIIRGVPVWTTGIVGGALRFDGAQNNYVALSSQLNVTDAMTIEAWVYPEFDPTNPAAYPQQFGDAGRQIVRKSSVGDDTFFIGFYSGYYFNHTNPVPYISAAFFYQGGGGAGLEPVSIPDLISQGHWYHLAATFKRNDYARLYVDGVEKMSVPTEDKPLRVSSRHLTIGQEADVVGGDPLDTASTPQTWIGKIDEVKIYNYATAPVSLPWIDDFNYNNQNDMGSAGWSVSETSPEWMTLLPGIARFDNDGTSGSSAYFLGYFPSGMTEFSVEAKSRWVGRSVGDNGNVYVITERHSYAWAGDGYYPDYMFVRDGVVIMRFDGYTPVMNQWTIFTLEKKGNTFYLYQDGQLKNTYIETDTTPDELVGVGIGAGWTSTMEYDYVSANGTGLALTPSTGFSSTTVAGSGFANNSKISITWDGTTIPTIPSPLTTDSTGTFVALISVPTQTAIGIHTVNATDESGNWKTATFTVVNMTGPQGSPGLQGQQGPKGDTGLQGQTGAQGLKGDKGDTGPQGSAGTLGETQLILIAFPTATSIFALCIAVVALLRKRS